MKIHYRNYCEIPNEVINKPKCLRYNKIKTVRRTVNLGKGEYSTEEENKPVMMYANTINNLKEILQHWVSVLPNSYNKNE